MSSTADVMRAVDSGNLASLTLLDMSACETVGLVTLLHVVHLGVSWPSQRHYTKSTPRCLASHTGEMLGLIKTRLYADDTHIYGFCRVLVGMTME